MAKDKRRRRKHPRCYDNSIPEYDEMEILDLDDPDSLSSAEAEDEPESIPYYDEDEGDGFFEEEAVPMDDSEVFDEDFEVTYELPDTDEQPSFAEELPPQSSGRARHTAALAAVCGLFLAALAVVGFFLYRDYRSRIYSHAVIEAGNAVITPGDFQKNTAKEVTFTEGFDMESIDTTVPGDYTILLTSAPFHYEATLTIEDTTPPNAQPSDVVLEYGDQCEADMFVSEIDDVQEVTVSYAKEPDFTHGGEQEVSILLTDLSGNQSTLNSSLLIIPVHYTLTMEAGGTLPVLSDFIIDELSASTQMAELTLLSDLSLIDTTVPGDYPVQFALGENTFETVLTVADTIAPVIKLAPQSGFLTAKLEASAFVAEADDVTELSYRFEPEPDYTKAGDQTVTVIATDLGGNSTSESTTLTLEADTEPPEIIGAMDMTVFKDHPVSYRTSVAVTDNSGEEIPLEISADEVNVKVPGTYPVTYRAVDGAGNATEVTINVSVIEETYSEETINALAQQMLSQILTPGMSEYDKLDAIYWWVRKNIAYTDMDIKDDWLKAAYYGLALHKGDCYVYCMTSRALLDAAGIKNMVIDTVPLRYIHYWNLVDIGEGWHHFDTTPRAAGGVFLYLDDASITAYSEAHSNSHIYDRNRFPDIP